jgi:hypothetical protein
MRGKIHWLVILSTGAAAAIMLTCCATHFPKNRDEVISNLHDADYSAQAFVLSMAALKGFDGDIHYLGSDSRFDYFRVERKRGFFRMERKGNTLSGHRRFAVGTETPFPIGRGVIPYPIPSPTSAGGQ